jgi:hypothetical protein
MIASLTLAAIARSMPGQNQLPNAIDGVKVKDGIDEMDPRSGTA